MHFLLLLGIVTIGVSAKLSPNCRSVTIPVLASAENLVLTNLPDPTNATAHAEYMLNALFVGPQTDGTQTISGNFRIAGTYCTPPRGIVDRKVLQLMVHGGTYNREMWVGLDLSPIYNWHLVGTSAGYHTLAIDRLGCGASEHPDAFQVVQGTLEVEILHAIISQLRSTGVPTAKIRSFSQIAYICHSYGCILGTHLAKKYPLDIRVYVLTGMTSTVTPPIGFFQDLYPAAALGTGIPRLDALPYGYLTTRTEGIRTGAFYSGLYDSAVTHVDYAKHRDTFTAGEAASGIALAVAPEYDGSLFFAVGVLDALVCADPATGELGYDICGRVLKKARTDLFPGVEEGRFGSYVAKQAGHTLGLHYSAPLTMVAIHRWLGDMF